MDFFVGGPEISVPEAKVVKSLKVVLADPYGRGWYGSTATKGIAVDKSSV